MYMYIAIICIHIVLFVSRSRYLPNISLCYPPALVSMPFFPCLSFRLILPSRDYPLYHWEQVPRVIGTRSSRVITPFPPSPLTYPVLQLALRSVLLPHFAFKIRLSLPNNIILSLDTSPCEGGRRFDSFDSRQPSTRGTFLFFSFPTYLLFSAYTAN